MIAIIIKRFLQRQLNGVNVALKKKFTKHIYIKLSFPLIVQ